MIFNIIAFIYKSLDHDAIVLIFFKLPNDGDVMMIFQRFDGNGATNGIDSVFCVSSHITRRNFI